MNRGLVVRGAMLAAVMMSATAAEKSDDLKGEVAIGNVLSAAAVVYGSLIGAGKGCPHPDEVFANDIQLHANTGQFGGMEFGDGRESVRVKPGDAGALFAPTAKLVDAGGSSGIAFHGPRC